MSSTTFIDMSSTTSETSTLTRNLINFTSQHAGTYVLPFNTAWAVMSTCIIVTCFIFGVIANSATIAVIHSSRRLKNHYFTFLQSICVSDILSAFASILFLYRRIWGFEYFHLPDFFCRFYWGLDLWTSFSTACHILSFAVLRLIGVRWPTEFKRISSRYMKLWIGTIWIVTFLFGFIPHFLFNTINDIDRENDLSRVHFASCSLSPSWIPTWRIYAQISYSIFLYIPGLSIIGISIAIAILLKRKRVPPGERDSYSPKPSRALTIAHTNSPCHSNTSIATPKSSSRNNRKADTSKRETPAERRWRKDKQAILQLFLIVGSFLVGYIPITVFHFYTVFNVHDGTRESNAFDWRFAMIQYFMLRFSECLNPVFYNLASKKMRKETIQMMKHACRLSSKSKERHVGSQPVSSSNI